MGKHGISELMKCEICGKEFLVWHSRIKQGKGRFCSKVCSGKSQRSKVTKECQQCGKSFEAAPNQIKLGYANFCSHECHEESRKAPVELICQQCGKPFTVQPNRVKNGWGQFCSIICRGMAKRDRTECSCLQCGKRFVVNNARIKHGQGKYCSHQCEGKARTGEKSGSWKGGISFEPYCPKFNKEFKESIRDAFGRTCFLCGKKEIGKKHAVHHIDYNKNSICRGKAWAFVPICQSCHGKTKSLIGTIGSIC